MSFQVVTRERLWYAGLAVFSILGAGALLPMTDLYRWATIFAIPAVAIGVLILKNPFLGTYLYYFYEFFRPYDFVPALVPLRLSMLIEIVTVLSLALMLMRTRRAIRWDKFNWFLILFIAVLAAGTFLAINNFLGFKIFRLMIITLVMFVVATNTIDRFERFNKIWWMMLIIHAFYAVKGMFGYLLNPGAAQTGAATTGAVGASFMADENDFALAMNVMIPFAFFTMLYVRKPWQKLFCLCLLIALVVAVVMSFSRGGWVGMVTVALYCVWYSGRRMHGFVGLAFAAVLFIGLAPSDYLSEIETISDTKESTAASRIRYWKAGINMMIDNPVVGVGPANGGMHMPYYLKGTRDPNTQWGRAFHGLIPQVGAETGMVGLALYFTMIAYVLTFLNKIRKRDPTTEQQRIITYWAQGLIGAIIAFLVTATFLSTAWYPQLWTMLTFSVCLLWIQRSIDKEEADKLSITQPVTLETKQLS